MDDWMIWMMDSSCGARTISCAGRSGAPAEAFSAAGRGAGATVEEGVGKGEEEGRE